MRLFPVRSSLDDISSSSSDSDSESDSGSISGPPSVRTPSIDVNHHPTHDVPTSDNAATSMRSSEPPTSTTKGKEKMNITDEDFARSVFAEVALAQFEEYSRGLRWGRSAPPSEKDRVLEEFLEDQAFLNTEELVANLAATLRPLQADEIRRRSPSTESADEEEDIEHTIVFPPTPRIVPTVIPMWSRSNEPDDQPVCCACKSQITGKLIKLDCGNKYDTECLMQMFEANVNDEYRFPPRCCGVVVPLLHVQDQLPKETLDLYNAKIEEYSTPSRLYCSNPQCARFLGSRDRVARQANCGACQAETCARCTAPHHPSKRCKVDKDVRATLQLGQSNGWQRCPQCRQLVERHDGCYHMSCRCGMQFCYLCAGNWGRCKCWKRRFFVKALLMRWLHLRGNYLVKDEPAAKKVENPVTRLCKRSWSSVKKSVTPPSDPGFSLSARDATIASSSAASASLSIASLDRV